MDAYLALEKDTLNRLEDREFIKWLIEDLDRHQLGVLLFSCDIKLPNTSIEKLPIPFIHNKLIGARKKLVQAKALPPFPFISVDGEEEFTEKKIIELAEKEKCTLKETALMLFLQHHFKATLRKYDHRDDEQPDEGELEKERPKVKEEASKKIEKILKKKIKNLTKDKEIYLEQVHLLKEELKQKNLLHQKKINELKRKLAEEVSENARLREKKSHLKDEIEKETAEKKQLSAQILVLETKMAEQQKRIALIGNPMNTSILTKGNYEVDIYEIEEVDRLIETWLTYDDLFYLTYTIDEMIYKETVPEHIRNKVRHIENFKKLKETMEEL